MSEIKRSLLLLILALCLLAIPALAEHDLTEDQLEACGKAHITLEDKGQILYGSIIILLGLAVLLFAISSPVIIPLASVGIIAFGLYKVLEPLAYLLIFTMKCKAILPWLI